MPYRNVRFRYQHNFIPTDHMEKAKEKFRRKVLDEYRLEDTQQQIDFSTGELLEVFCEDGSESVVQVELQGHDGMTMGSKPRNPLQEALVVMKFVQNDANPCLLTNYPYLAIGSIGAAYSLTALQSHHITHILTLSPVCRVKYPDKFHYLKHSISDNCSTNIFLILDSCFEFIEQARLTHGRVLIHCFQGISRSATILSAYLMKYHQLSLEEALQAIREVRPIVQPNATFILSLKKFERQLKEERSGCAIDQREESSTNPSGEV